MSSLKKKVLLVKPDYQYWPIGFAYVARSLVDNDIDFDFIDTSVTGAPRWDSILAKGKYGAIATGGLIGNYTFFKETFNSVKRIDPSLPCILGGNVTIDLKPQLLFSTMPVDYLVVGEAEETFPLLLQTLDKEGADPATVDGIVFKEPDGRLTRTQRRPRLDLVAKNWMPYWDCLDTQHYLARLGHMPVMTGRGCTGRCTFCSPTNGQYMGRPVSQTIEEIKYLIAKYDIGSLAFLNEIFFPDDESILEFCREYKKIEPLRHWGCLMRVDLNSDVLQVMKDAGCVGPCNIGVESGSDRVLKLINKEVTVEQVRSFINVAKQVDMPLEASWMMANYGETAEDIKATVDLLIELKTCGPVAFTINYPGTANYRQAVAKGLIKDEVKYLESMDKLYGRNYFQVISDHLSGEIDYLNLSAMSTQDLFRTAEKEMRRYFTEIFGIEAAVRRPVEDGAWEYIGKCFRCGAEVRNVVPPNCLNYPFNRTHCKTCGLTDIYFSPFQSKRYRDAFAAIENQIREANRIIVFCFEQEFYDFFRYDLFGIDYDRIIGIVGHDGALSAGLPPLNKGYILNHPILSIDEIAKMDPDLLIVPGGYVPEEIRRQLYTKCPRLVAQQVSLTLPEHRLFSDTAEYRARLPEGVPSALAGASPRPGATCSTGEVSPTPRSFANTLLFGRALSVARRFKPIIDRAARRAGFTVIRTTALEAERSAAREEIVRLSEELERGKATDEKSGPHVGLSILGTTTLDISSELNGMPDRQLRGRIYRLEPGGWIASHSHKGHQAIAFIFQGTLSEHRDGKIIHHPPGDVLAETEDVAHWHENLGKEAVVFFAADIAWDGRG
jgi:radical SAM superfamily enzyme YgiQ (UPF0313 family)/quercetin dioxygenase-like cupin family protein